MGSGAFGLVWPTAITYPSNCLIKPTLRNDAPINLRVGLGLDKEMFREVFDQDSGPLEALYTILGDSDVNLFVPKRWPCIS